MVRSFFLLRYNYHREVKNSLIHTHTISTHSLYNLNYTMGRLFLYLLSHTHAISRVNSLLTQQPKNSNTQNQRRQCALFSALLCLLQLSGNSRSVLVYWYFITGSLSLLLNVNVLRKCECGLFFAKWQLCFVLSFSSRFFRRMLSIYFV